MGFGLNSMSDWKDVAQLFLQGPRQAWGLVSNAVAAFVTKRRTRSKELGIVEGAVHPYMVHTVAAVY